MHKFIRTIILFLLLTPALADASSQFPRTGNATGSVPERLARRHANPTTLDPAGDLQNEAARFLTSYLDNLRNSSTSLSLLHSRSTPYSHHFTYRQALGNLAVFQSEVKINVALDGRVLSIYDNSYPAGHVSEADILSRQVEFLASETYAQILMAYANRSLYETQTELVIYFSREGDAPVVALQLNILDLSTGLRELRIIDRSGRFLRRETLTTNYRSSIDTLVQAYVFLPDPVTSARADYEGDLQDHGDSATAGLNQERRLVDMRVEFNNGRFRLQREGLLIQDFLDPPNVVPAPVTPEFFFDRSQEEFEAVNAYYHITAIQDQVIQLGYPDLIDMELVVDPHAGFEDASWFTEGIPARLSFGRGGVDDAEDADVVVHEYLHALSFSASPGSNHGQERRSIDEGLADYLAASYSRSISEYEWFNIFNWDGHNPFWPGRSAKTAKIYPSDLLSNIHLDGEIISSALMEIWEDIGRDNTDRIVCQVLYSLAPNMSMADLAKDLLQVDTLINAGQYSGYVWNRLYAHGLLGIGNMGSRVVNTGAFLEPDGRLILLVDLDYEEAAVDLYDISGRHVYSIPRTQAKVIYLPKEILSASGIYFVQIRKADSGEAIRQRVIWLER